MILEIHEKGMKSRYVNVAAIDYMTGERSSKQFAIIMCSGAAIQIMNSQDNFGVVVEKWEKLLAQVSGVA